MDNSYVFSTSTILDNLCKSLVKSTQDQLCKIILHNNGLDFLKKLEENNITVDNDILLHQAAVTGRLDIIIYLKEKGVDLHCKYDDAFRFAAFHDHLDIVEYLLKDGADINSRKDDGLRACVNSNKLNMVKFLLDNGADINQIEEKSYKNAIEKNNVDLLKILSQKGISDKVKKSTSFAINLYKYLEIVKIVHYYYGVKCSKKQTITFPEIIEIEKDNSYYYVYLTEGKVVNLINKEVTMNIIVELLKSSDSQIEGPMFYQL